MKWGKAWLAVGLVLVVVVVTYITGVRQHWFGSPPDAGVITGAELPAAVVIARQVARKAAAVDAGAVGRKQIVFGDFHVHTTYSTDAFLWSLPMSGGKGVHPIGDACDYARYCSGLDFWGITDHAAASTPRRWQETKDSIRQCQALSGDPENPDLLSFIGFEWTQVGRLPDEHFGHKNVIFRDLDDAKVAARPIAATGVAVEVLRETMPYFPPALALTEGLETGLYLDFNAFLKEIRDVPLCDPQARSDSLPADCFEEAASPGELVRRLEEQGLDPLLIPHGSSWGFYTPPGTTWDKQLAATMRPEKFSIIEVMSGHGNSEEFRPWRAIIPGPDNDSGICPEPSPGYLPACWRAGQIIEQRCRDAGETAAHCSERAATARWNYANMSVAGHLAVDGESAADWLDAGQCSDCFLPSFNHRPGTSVQYGLAISNFDEGLDKPRRFDWGFIASSDNHRARPGTGYKPVDRMRNTEANGPVDEKWAKRIYGEPGPASSESRFFDRQQLIQMAGFQLTELERQSSFWLTGGLAAAHVRDRSRDGLWQAFAQREVYGTSGPKILLWFDLLQDQVEHPMGSHVTLSRTPRLRVRASGAFKQKPGCPSYAHMGLAPERLNNLCAGECDHPSDERHDITRLEVIRIRPQAYPEEPVADLIEDPWRVHQCAPGQDTCSFEFSDPEFVANPRDVLYYARAVQAATPTINADNLRCEYDADGVCIKVNPCYGDFRTAASEECTAPAEHRAWSSPITIKHAGAR